MDGYGLDFLVGVSDFNLLLSICQFNTHRQFEFFHRSVSIVAMDAAL